MKPNDQRQGSFPETLQKDVLRARDLGSLRKLAERKRRDLQDTVATLAKHHVAVDGTGVNRQLEENREVHERSNLILFKACVPLLLEEIGRAHSCIVRTLCIRLYTKMIRFAFECSLVSG